MDAERILESMVRIGTVTAVSGGRARVKFRDSEITSAWLSVLASPEPWAPKVNDTVLVLYLPVFNGDGYILGRL